ncbi:CHAT domain-containing protein [Nostoc flagelliforme]|nr:CHAT domain-containing protein [Nostoc flagelliforme]
MKSGTPKAEALRQAQLNLMLNSKYSHPYFWASFLLVGGWL